MKLATIRTEQGSKAVRIDKSHAVGLGADDLGSFLAHEDWFARAMNASGESIPLDGVEYAPLVASPGKIICVGLNYRSHILETGRPLPEYPTLFAKFPDSLLGADDDLVLPAVSDSVDWEAELGIVIGAPARRVDASQARMAIAGYTIINDISMRDWQSRTPQWLQGKTFEGSTPVGPWLVTPDEVDDAADLEIRCEVDGDVRQLSRTSDLLFGPAEIVSYISSFVTLRPGDLIATGTPGGTGAARNPKVFLAPGQVVRTAIEKLGQSQNVCVKEQA